MALSRPPLPDSSRSSPRRSLGVLMFELLVGKAPFDAPETEETQQRIRAPPPPPPPPTTARPKPPGCWLSPAAVRAVWQARTRWSSLRTAPSPPRRASCCSGCCRRIRSAASACRPCSTTRGPSATRPPPPPEHARAACPVPRRCSVSRLERARVSGSTGHAWRMAEIEPSHELTNHNACCRERAASDCACRPCPVALVARARSACEVPERASRYAYLVCATPLNSSLHGPRASAAPCVGDTARRRCVTCVSTALCGCVCRGPLAARREAAAGGRGGAGEGVAAHTSRGTPIQLYTVHTYHTQTIKWV
jgi:serine/threonine protein kinase